MTAAWSTSDAIRDASDQTASAADDALGEVYAAWDGWPDEERPTKAELDRDEWGYER